MPIIKNGPKSVAPTTEPTQSANVQLDYDDLFSSQSAASTPTSENFLPSDQFVQPTTSADFLLY